MRASIFPALEDAVEPAPSRQLMSPSEELCSAPLLVPKLKTRNKSQHNLARLVLRLIKITPKSYKN